MSELRPVNLSTAGPAVHGARPGTDRRPPGLDEALAARPPTGAATRCRRGRPLAARTSTPGPASATSAATTSRRYACYRVGYHRGLDRLRANGWRGSGYVRWEHEPNRGFLRALRGCGRAAAAIGEADEAERCAQFLAQLDPSLRVE